MLNSDSRPVKPAAIAAMVACCSVESALNVTSGADQRARQRISCNIGDAMPITPMPADTFMHSTIQIIQNCLVLCASLRWTLCCEIIALAFRMGSSRQDASRPAGCGNGTRRSS